MRLKICEWLDERRETRKLEKALSDLPAPDVPEDVGAAWMQTPQLQRQSPQRGLFPRPWVVLGLMLAPAAAVYAQGGATAIAETITRATTPKAMVIPLPEAWLIQYAYISIVVLFGVIIGGFIAIRHCRRLGRPVLWKYVALPPICVVSSLLVLYLATLSSIIRVLVAVGVSGYFFGFAFALASAWVQVQSTLSGFRSYLRHLGLLIIVGFLWLAVYGWLSLEVFKDLGRPIWIAGLVVGWMVAPIFRKSIRIIEPENG